MFSKLGVDTWLNKLGVEIRLNKLGDDTRLSKFCVETKPLKEALDRYLELPRPMTVEMS